MTFVERLSLYTLISTAVPAPEAASNPTARMAWDQWNLYRAKVPTGAMVAAAAGCKLWVVLCVWTFVVFPCPSATRKHIQVTTITYAHDTLWSYPWSHLNTSYLLPWFAVVACALGGGSCNLQQINVNHVKDRKLRICVNSNRQLTHRHAPKCFINLLLCKTLLL